MSKIQILILCTFLSVWSVTAFITAAVLTAQKAYSQIVVTPQATPHLTIASALPTPTPDPLAPFSVLLLGMGGEGHQGGTLTDSMILAHINQRAEKITLISIPRDIWVALPIIGDTLQNFKINHAYAIGIDDRKYPDKNTQYAGLAGGGALSKYAVEKVLGLPVRYFVTLDFNGFKKTIDTLGGIDVQITKKFTDKYYPIKGEESNSCGKSDEDIVAIHATLSGYLLEQSYECRYETISFDIGMVHMDGETALKFARSRHSEEDGSDFSRSSRQKSILLATREKVFSLGFVTKALPFIQSLSGSLRTDIDVRTIQEYMGRAQEFRGYEVSSVSLSTDNVFDENYSSDGQYILVPKGNVDSFEGVQNYLKDLLEVSE